MANCSDCSVRCPAGGSLEITAPELALLRELSQLAFLPVARLPHEEFPHGLPDTEEMTLVLQCLEKKDLISIDYHSPLKGFDYAPFGALNVHGSMGLTQRGLAVLELLDIQGIS